MCQITVANLHKEEYNKLFFLLSGSIGSMEHPDGWGFVTGSGENFKCQLPMHITSNSGHLLDITNQKKNDGVLIGHIRQASAKIPVTVENAHPFTEDNVSMIHNGKLVPRNDKEFDIEYEVEEYDDKDKKNKKKTYHRSDSYIFFLKFMEYWKAESEENIQTKFVTVFNKTMAHFYGKFAMVFRINDKTFIARGNTADLYLSFLLDKNGKSLGWVINTNSKVLNFTTTMMSNIVQLRGGEELSFSLSSLLPKESLYIAEDYGIVKIGECPEELAPVTSYTTYKGGATNFTEGGTTQNQSGKTTGIETGKKSRATKYAEIIYNFLQEYSLSVVDLNNFMLIGYNSSLNEVEESTVHHFCHKVIPMMKNLTSKPIRKSMKKAVVTYLATVFYKNLDYPWMMNDRSVQGNIIQELTKNK